MLIYALIQGSASFDTCAVNIPLAFIIGRYLSADCVSVVCTQTLTNSVAKMLQGGVDAVSTSLLPTVVLDVYAHAREIRNV
jgi:hypothetical protein